MSNLAWKHPCDCCGRTYMVSLDTNPNGSRCEFCARRGGLCMHNVFARVAAGGEPIMHSSRPHRDDTGANDPRTCQWCLVKLLERGES